MVVVVVVVVVVDTVVDMSTVVVDMSTVVVDMGTVVVDMGTVVVDMGTGTGPRRLAVACRCTVCTVCRRLGSSHLRPRVRPRATTFRRRRLTTIFPHRRRLCNG